MVVGNTVDPASPYHAAVALRRELGHARLLTVDGYGHGARSGCTNRFTTRYLITQILPPPNARCGSVQPFTAGTRAGAAAHECFWRLPTWKGGVATARPSARL